MNDNVAAWIRKSDNDRRAADNLMRSSPPLHDEVCFHCQQCAEKFIKAIFTQRGVEFPKTHDQFKVARLLNLDPTFLEAITDDLALLTPFAVDFRYPDANLSNAEEASAACERLKSALLPLLDP